jgi:hypothetical protein
LHILEAVALVNVKKLLRRRHPLLMLVLEALHKAG